ncbi:MULTISPECIES: HD domain-containing protein [Calditerrivibrio]|uniref:Ppx/GppA phosphatase family protein n=1 Tax=Calditerrivibrio TaxID=545865 RepID=UPI003C741BD0
MKSSLYAVINVGASAVRMQISEFVNGKETLLEYLVSPLRLGRDTFSKGYITLESLNKAVDIMKKFADKLTEYDLWKNYKAICTSGVRDADNKYFFIDRIKTKTGIELNIIDGLEELYVKYLAIKNDIKDFKKFEEEGVLLLNFSSGNVGINIFKNGINLFSSVLPYGSLRIAEYVKNIKNELKHRAFDIYAEKLTNQIKQYCKGINEIKYLIGSGSSINLLTEVTYPKSNTIKKSDLEKLYNKVKFLEPAAISQELKVSDYNGEIFLPTVRLYLSIMNMLGTKEMIFSKQTFPHQLLLYYSKKIKENNLQKKIIKNLLHFGKKYNLDEKHAKQVSNFSLKLFDALEDLHSLGNKEKFILEAASLLHDIGYYIDIHNHHEHSSYIISSFKMPGYDKNAMRIISVISYLHRGKKVKSDHIFNQLSPDDQLVIKKIVAILKIADALDASHMQIVQDINVSVSDNVIKITAISKDIPYIEEKVFNRKNRDFLEIFGIPILFEAKIGYE